VSSSGSPTSRNNPIRKKLPVPPATLASLVQNYRGLIQKSIMKPSQPVEQALGIVQK
jgi:hypothetical protein